MSSATYELVGDLAVLTLHHGRAPILTAQIFEDLGMHLATIRSEAPRALLLRAAGDNFAAGGDVAGFPGMSEEVARSTFGRQLGVIHDLEDLDIPTIAAVQGVCLGGGVELALACDLIVAAEGTTFGQVEARMGAITFLGGVQRLAARAGSTRALHIAYTGTVFPVETFEAWGIVATMLPTAGFEEAALAFASTLSNGPTAAHRVTKQLVRMALDNGARSADALMLEIGPPVVASADLQAAAAALVEHGPRRFMADPSLVTFQGK